jgi:hypothetical protein
MDQIFSLNSSGCGATANATAPRAQHPRDRLAGSQGFCSAKKDYDFLTNFTSIQGSNPAAQQRLQWAGPGAERDTVPSSAKRRAVAHALGSAQ